MKHVLILFCVMCLVIAVGTVAQTQDESKQVVAKPTPDPTPEASKTPRVYPIAAGIWYPGQPLPEKPFRYYRIRCWPGCHTYGRYANPPKAKKSPSKSQATPTAPTDKK